MTTPAFEVLVRELMARGTERENAERLARRVIAQTVVITNVGEDGAKVMLTAAPELLHAARRADMLLGTVLDSATHYRQGTGQLGGGRMNKTETLWSEQLELQRAGGEVRWWKNHALSLRLADRTWYRPDFLVELRGGRLSIDEVKGHWEDAARVKFKVAAELYPMFLFRAIRREGRSSRLRVAELFNA